MKKRVELKRDAEKILTFSNLFLLSRILLIYHFQLYQAYCKLRVAAKRDYKGMISPHNKSWAEFDELNFKKGFVKKLQNQAKAKKEEAEEETETETGTEKQEVGKGSVVVEVAGVAEAATGQKQAQERQQQQG